MSGGREATDQAAYDTVVQSYDVSWAIGPTTVYGTLVKPEGPGPFPGVVFVAGSGPTDRDWNTPLLAGTNGSGRLLAEALGHAGFASLRYDKRASGPHVRETLPLLIGKMSMQSHLDELTSAVSTLADEHYIRGDRIFGLGHSEGTLHVLNYVLSDPAVPFAGVVLTGPPGRSVGDVARSQLTAQAAATPDGAELLALYDASITRFLAGEPIAPDPALPDGVAKTLVALAAPANLPFAHELWTADAATPLGRVSVPGFVIIGKKDVQVDWQADGEQLQRKAAGRENVAFLFPENANHVLKYEPRPRSELVPAQITISYNAPYAHLDPETATAIVAWLQAHA